MSEPLLFHWARHLHRYKAGNRATSLMTIAALARSSGNMAIAFMALYLVNIHHVPPLTVGSMLFWFGVGSLCGAYGSSFLSDKFPLPLLMRNVLILAAMSVFGLIFIDHIIGIGICIFFIGLTDGAYRPIYNGIILRLCAPEDRAKVYSFYLMAVNVGYAIAGIVGGLLAEGGYYWIFLVNAFAILVAFWIQYMAVPNILPGSSSTEIKAHKEDPNGTSPYRDFGFMIIAISVLLGAIVSFQVNSTYSLYLSDSYHFSTATYGLLLSISGILAVLLQLPITYFMEKYSHLSLVTIGTILLCGGFAILPLSSQTWFAFFSLGIWSIGEVILYPPLMALIMARAANGNSGHYLGIYHSLFSLAHLIAAPVGTGLYQVAGGTILWVSCGIAGAVAAVFMWIGFKMPISKPALSPLRAD